MKYFTLEKTYSVSSNNNSTGGKVQSLNGMVFMGDSILSMISINSGQALEKEGAKTMYRGGCTANYFLGREKASGNTKNCKEKDGYFDWNANFEEITNPTGFYLFLGQNFRSDKNGRIKQMDDLVKTIRGSYPQAPIFINSVYRDMTGNNEKKKKDADEMNEELKTYCSQNVDNNVYYSDTLREYDEDDESFKSHTYDNDHPNKEGANIIIKNLKENIIGDNSSSDDSSSSQSETETDTSSTTGTTATIANISRTYNNDIFEKDTSISTQKKMSNPFAYNREYRSSQSGCYDGQYIIHFQNKNYRNSSGTYTVDASSKGGRIAWSNLETGEIDFTVEVGAEGGHGDGMAFDSDRNMVLKYSSSKEGNLLEIDNSTKTIVGHTKMDVSCEKITYLNTTKQLVALSGGKFIFMKYDQAQNKYVKQNVVPLKNYKINVGLQGIGTDGQVIYVSDSGPGSSSSNYRVWTYTLDGERVEEHRVSFGGEEPEAVLSDNQGSLWAICNQHLFKIKNYRANPANMTSTGNAIFNNTTYQVKVATWSKSSDKVTSNDPSVSTYETASHYMSEITVPYQQIVSKYRIPFNYLWTMLVVAKDKKYTFELADLAKNSNIEITIHDNYNWTKTVTTDTYTNHKDVTAIADVKVKYLTNEGEIALPHSQWYNSIQKNSKINIVYTKTQTNINETNTLDIGLTLADAWCTKYEKIYEYHKPETTNSSSSAKLDDIIDEPQTVSGDFGGMQSQIDQDALNRASDSERSELSIDTHRNVRATYKNSVIDRNKTINTTTKTSSYTSAGSQSNFDTGPSMPVANSIINQNNVTQVYKNVEFTRNKAQQGFCIVNDQYLVFTNANEGSDCDVYLYDIKSQQNCNSIKNLEGHGNSVTYDSVEKNILVLSSEKRKIHVLKINDGKIQKEREIVIPGGKRGSLAYNKENDLFNRGVAVASREQFYSASSNVKYYASDNKPANVFDQGEGSIGNHEFIVYNNNRYNGNCYITVVNLKTKKQEELISVNLMSLGSYKNELEEVDFDSSGNMYIAYADHTFYKTSYNYFNDSNLSGKTTSNSNSSGNISRYNTGGEYTDNNKFVGVFNGNYNARSNILSVKGWLFDALEQNDDTKRMVDLTKYLMYKATGTDYGVTEFDFDAYQLEDFVEIGGQGLEGNNTEERVWLALINAGFNDVAAAAAMGNLSYESGGSGSKTIKIDSVEGGYTEDTGGIGMCQWTNNNRGTEGRNAQLKKYAQSKGTSWKDEKTQIEFLITEITGEGNAKGYANLQFMTKTYDGVTYPKDALKTVQNTQDQIEYATKAFAATFERPAASAFTASMSKRVELAKHFYSLYNGKRGSSIGNGDILKACEEVMQIYLSRNAEYSIQRTGEGPLIYNNIEKCLNEAKYACCATYTSSVLYKSGLLTAAQINKYNYHYTGSGGVPDMLQAAGWRRVNMSEIKPGDVVVDYTVHVLIYAGGDNYYDNNTCIHGSSYKNYYPAKKRVMTGFSYYRNKNVQVWRAPGR